MGNRCQVCDGPVVNGRCKYCGMPYRNDEVLYHLNESRSEHYRHATPQAKKIMKNQEIPLQDRKASLGRTSSKEEIKAHQQKIRQDAVKRMTTTKARPEGNSGAGTARNTAGKTAGNIAGKSWGAGQNVRKQTEKKNQKKASVFSLVISVIVVLFGLVPTVGEYIMEHKESINLGGTGIVSEFTDGTGQELLFEQEAYGNGNMAYYLGREYGEVTVGSELNEGTYKVSAESGSAQIIVCRGNMVKSYTVEESGESVVLLLHDGDTVCVQPDSSAKRVVMYQLSNS
ncbi:MAG: hypothetical protein Q4C77_06150 [Eubacteriales bacterium]|nr:hypothetical protein [Eubacteriales bacterium]